MATVVDALLVTLGIDASGFSQGVKQTEQGLNKVSEAGNRTQKDMDVVAKSIVSGFQRVRTEVLGLFALFTAGKGLKEFASSVTSSDAATGRLATSLGMSTEALSSWQVAAERSGGTADGISSSIASLSADLEKFKLTGQMSDDEVNWFVRLGISVTDANGKVKQATDLFADFARKFPSLSPQERNLAGSIFHLDQGTINTLAQGIDKVTQLRNEAMRLGLPTDADAKRAQTLLNDVANIQQAFTSFARTILNEVSPALDAMMKQIIAFIETNGPRIKAEVTDKIEAAIRWLQGVDWTAMLAGIGQVIDKLGHAVDAISHMNPALKSVAELVGGAWLLGMLGPIAKVTAALAGVGTGLTGALGGGSALVGGAAIAGGVGIGAGLGYEIEKLIRGKAVADQHLREGGTLTGTFFERMLGAVFGIKPSNSAGDGRSQQDDFIDRFTDRFVQKLAVSRALSLIAADGTVAGSFGLGDNGSIASPGEMARAHGVRAGAGQAALGSPETQAREKQAFDFFRSRGWSAEDAAGITARIKRESGFREGAIGDRGAAFGLLQWHRDRQDALRSAGYDLTNASYQRQLEAIDYETTRGREQAAGARIRAARTAEAAGDAASRYYARPGDVEGEAAATAAEAARILRRQTPSAPGAVPMPGQPAGAPFIVGSAAQRWGNSVTNNRTTHDNSIESHIGTVNVVTQATDAQGIARSIKQQLESQVFANQINTGLA